jgi:hypothetical protein
MYFSSADVILQEPFFEYAFIFSPQPRNHLVHDFGVAMAQFAVVEMETYCHLFPLDATHGNLGESRD